MLYSNDLPSILISPKYNLYADDSATAGYGHTVVEVVEKLNVEFKMVTQWFNINKLSVNINKTKYNKSKYMFFGTKNKQQMPTIPL